MNVTHGELRHSERWPWLFGGIRPVTRAGAVRDALAGVTLAAMNVPQALGYTRIAGTPVVTGLYTLLLPLVPASLETPWTETGPNLAGGGRLVYTATWNWSV